MARSTNKAIWPATFYLLHSLHYGQAIFEGMKAYKGSNDEAYLFRPEQNAKRLNKSAVRMCMPEIPEKLFLEGLYELLRIDEKWIPNDGTSSLYIRPFMYGSSNFIKARPSNDYTFIIITCPVQTYYTGEVHVKVELDYTRASGGTGSAKLLVIWRIILPSKNGSTRGLSTTHLDRW